MMFLLAIYIFLHLPISSAYNLLGLLQIYIYSPVCYWFERNPIQRNHGPGAKRKLITLVQLEASQATWISGIADPQAIGRHERALTSHGSGLRRHENLEVLQLWFSLQNHTLKCSFPPEVKQASRLRGLWAK